MPGDSAHAEIDRRLRSFRKLPFLGLFWGSLSFSSPTAPNALRPMTHHLLQHPSRRPTSSAVLVALVAFSLLLSGCSSVGDDTSETIVDPVGIAKIDSVSQKDRSVWIRVRGSWPNGCGTFSRMKSSQDGRSYRIKMYGEQPRGAFCTTNFVPVFGEWETTVPEAGTYTFRFWQTDSTTLDTTLTFE